MTRVMLKLMKRKAMQRIYGIKNPLQNYDDLIANPVPNVVGAEITNICNAKCSFCGYGKKNTETDADPRKKGKLNHQVLKHTAKLFSESGGGQFSLSPILGEITVDPRWLELVRHISSYDNITGVSCFTNAILLHRFDSEDILTSGLTQMTISTNLSSKERYQDLYGVDKYEIVLSNILNLLSKNQALGCPVQISLALRLDKPYEEFFKTEVYKSLLDLLPANSISILDDYWDDFKGLVEQRDLPSGQQFKRQVAQPGVPCYALYRKLQVLVDGTIQGCSCRVEPELWTENILDHKSLGTAWKNQGLEKLRQNWLDGVIPSCCKTCSHYMPFTNLLHDDSYRNLVVTFFQKLFVKVGLQKVRINHQNSAE